MEKKLQRKMSISKGMELGIRKVIYKLTKDPSYPKVDERNRKTHFIIFSHTHYFFGYE